MPSINEILDEMELDREMFEIDLREQYAEYRDEEEY